MHRMHTPVVTRAAFGRLPDGRTVDRFTLANAHGIEIGIIPYGGIIASLKTPDRAGHLDDIVLGYDSLAGYVGDASYMGTLTGRFAGRIGGARFTLDGVSYALPANNGPNHLHGGTPGFDKALWNAEPFQTGDGSGVVLTHMSPDGDQGYPGTLTAQVTYTLADDDTFAVDYAATTDRPTPVTLTQHAYFNLAGEGTRDILGHELTMHADRFLLLNTSLIPTGELAAVTDTPFDFRKGTAIGARIEAADAQLTNGKGYDHCFAVNRNGAELAPAASVVEPQTGRTLQVHTTEPGIVFYSGNFLDGGIIGKSGRPYRHRSGFCLETQHFPDAPNQPSFPSTILRPGTPYRSRTVFAFGVQS